MAIRYYCPAELWEIAEPLAPPVPPHRQGSGLRRKALDRAVLAALVPIDRTVCACRYLLNAFG